MLKRTEAEIIQPPKHGKYATNAEEYSKFL